MATDPNANIRIVVEEANRAVPKLADTEDMGSTVKTAQAMLDLVGFEKVQLDRWDHPDGISIELGYAHGEVWYRGWKRVEGTQWPPLKIKTQSVHPEDLTPLVDLIEDLREGRV